MSASSPSLDFAAKHLGGRPAPDDLRRLLDLQARDAASGSANPLRQAGVRFLDSDQPPALVAAALRGRDDLDGIARLAHAQAMADMVRMCGFVAEDAGGDAIGYWFGPAQTPIDAAPAMRFDASGSFSIAPGNGVAEAVLVIASHGDERAFAALRDWLNQQGFAISAQSIGDIERRGCAQGPQTVYARLTQTYFADLSAASTSGVGDPVQIMATYRGPKIS